MTEYKYAAKVDPELKAEIAMTLEASNLEWEQTGISPSPLDFVRMADLLLMEKYEGYGGSTPEGRDFLADSLYEEMSAGKLDDWREMTEYLVDCLVAE